MIRDHVSQIQASGKRNECPVKTLCSVDHIALEVCSRESLHVSGQQTCGYRGGVKSAQHRLCAQPGGAPAKSCSACVWLLAPRFARRWLWDEILELFQLEQNILYLLHR